MAGQAARGVYAGVTAMYAPPEFNRELALLQSGIDQIVAKDVAGDDQGQHA
jgi:hypothetical protein